MERLHQWKKLLIITMTEDPSAGYIVKGYYANDDIAGAPQELKKLGTMQDLNKILESKMNDTINGSSYGLDEIFCSLSHKESDQIVKIMRFCFRLWSARHKSFMKRDQTESILCLFHL